MGSTHAPLAEKAAPRVAVGHAHDPEEREADRVAAILTAPAKLGCSACAAGAAPCPACAGSAAKLRRSALAQGPASAPARPLHGAGAPLPAATRQRFERRLGVDLGGVRLHRGAEAAAATAAVGARAFALGRDIAFGARAPAPESAEGERLLAHEVAHTVQAGAATTLRRANDFTIRGLSPRAASDPGTIYFDFASATLEASEQAKIPALAAPPTRRLTLFGYASEEGSAASRTAMTGRRIGSVDSALAGAGHTAQRDPRADITRGEGNLDYRSMRSVAVVPTPVGVAAPPPVSPLGSGACTMAIPCGTSFNNAIGLALVQVIAAKAQVDLPTPAAATQVATLFPGTPVAQIQGNMAGLLTELSGLPANHRCHDYPCDAACDRPAYADPSTHMMTLCPDFVNSTDLTENATLLIHEALHMVTGLTTIDFAYRRSRFIDFIPGTQSQTNTDSFVLLVIRLSGSTAAGPPADPVGSLAAGEQLPARRALAFAEQWLLEADWRMKLLYEGIKANRGSASGWTQGSAPAAEARMQRAIAATFGLTDPGAAPHATAPTQADQEIVAGLADRYRRMMFALWTRPITATNGAADAWGAGLGNAVVLSPAFFALSAPDQVLRLIELMAGSLTTSDVPATRRRDYATGAQLIWRQAGRTGP